MTIFQTSLSNDTLKLIFQRKLAKDSKFNSILWLICYNKAAYKQQRMYIFSLIFSIRNRITKRRRKCQAGEFFSRIEIFSKVEIFPGWKFFDYFQARFLPLLAAKISNSKIKFLPCIARLHGRFWSPGFEMRLRLKFWKILGNGIPWVYLAWFIKCHYQLKWR